MGGDLLSFDEALAELQMGTHELRSLVAQGEIRAYRDEDILKFRRTDVLDLKKTRDTDTTGGLVIEPEDPTAINAPLLIDEPPTQMIPQASDAATTAPPPIDPKVAQPETDLFPGLELNSTKSDTEETELVSGLGQGMPLDFLGLDDGSSSSDGIDTAQTVVPTIEISSDDLIDDTAKTIVPAMEPASDTDILFGDQNGSTSTPTLLEDDEQTEMATQEINPEESSSPTTVVEDKPLSFADGSTEAAPVPEDIGLSTEDIAQPSATMTASMTAPRRTRLHMAETAAERPYSPIFLGLAILTFIMMLFALPLFYGIATDTAPTFAPYKDLMQLFGP